MDTVEVRVLACRELLAAESPKRARHLELGLPPGVAYRVGDHLGVCPKNDEERVDRLARHLGAALDGLFTVPKTMNVRTVPKGVVLQVRNVLTSLVDITGRPTAPLLDLSAGEGNRRWRAGEAGADQGRLAGARGGQLTAARGDRRGRLRPALAPRGVPVLLAEHL
jgi:sulfite reductase alpha subunit-like flavoprotein